MTNLFAEYEPDRHGETIEESTLRAAGSGDVVDLARLSSARDGTPLEETLERFEREIAKAGDPTLWVVERQGQAVAFGRLGLLESSADCPRNHQPTGWYLMGVIVADEWRRRGFARRLTEARLEYLIPRTEEVFYFVNANNRASVDLHASFGFEELTRDFSVPGVTFTGGVGILSRLDLRRWAQNR